MNYHKLELLVECMKKYYEAYAETLDTADFVPDKLNNKITKKIYKEQKKSFKEIDKEYKKYNKNKKKEAKKKLKLKRKQLKVQKKANRKHKLIPDIKKFFTKIFKKKQ